MIAALDVGMGVVRPRHVMLEGGICCEISPTLLSDKVKYPYNHCDKHHTQKGCEETY